MTALAPREGYRLWAPVYEAENAISTLENQLVGRMTPPLAGLRLLDAGCGTGRRLRGCGAARAVGVDLSPDMLAAAGAFEVGVELMAGDVEALPLPDATFDMIWCRLVIGHLADVRTAYRELGRVAAPGARLIVTDFHPAAAAAGHRRSFRAGGEVHEVEHHVHTLGDHFAAAWAAGLALADVAEGKVGPSIRRYYEDARRLDRYDRDEGLPLVVSLAFVKA